MNLKTVELAIFNAYHIKSGKYVDYDELKTICEEIQVPMVEVLEEGDKFNYTLEELITKSKGFYPGTENPREGIVYRLRKNWNDGDVKFSFKVINNDYLIKKK